MDTNTNNQTQSSTTVQQSYQTVPPQQVVYVQKKSRFSWLVSIFGCGGCFLFILLLCIFPLMFISILTSGNSGITGRGDNVQQTVIGELGNRDASESGKIVVINITGEITYSMPNETHSSAASSANIIAQLNKAKDDETVSVVLLRWNSPGGYTTAAEPICNAIKKTNETKPVYSFIDSQGASLAYLLPNCTKYIYARPAAITGSIGVIIQAVDFYGILEKLGGKVVFITNTAGSQKSGEDIFTPGSETYKTYQKLLDESYEYFIDKVYQGRIINHPSITKEQIRSYADGRIFSGAQAKAAGLIDETAEFDETITKILLRENLAEKKIDIVEYQILSNPFANFFRTFEATLKNTDVKNQVANSQTVILMKEGIITAPMYNE